MKKLCVFFCLFFCLSLAHAELTVVLPAECVSWEELQIIDNENLSNLSESSWGDYNAEYQRVYKFTSTCKKEIIKKDRAGLKVWSESLKGN